MEGDRKIVFYDGLCGFCDGTVQFLLARDGKRALRYAALQGRTAERLLDASTRSNLDTVIFLDGDHRFERSDAAIRLVSGLGGPWQLLRVLLVIPRRWRDAGYDAFAKRRYQLFGKLDRCRLPTPEERALFLD